MNISKDIELLNEDFSFQGRNMKNRKEEKKNLEELKIKKHAEINIENEKKILEILKNPNIKEYNYKKYFTTKQNIKDLFSNFYVSSEKFIDDDRDNSLLHTLKMGERIDNLPSQKIANYIFEKYNKKEICFFLRKYQLLDKNYKEIGYFYKAITLTNEIKLITNYYYEKEKENLEEDLDALLTRWSRQNKDYETGNVIDSTNPEMTSTDKYDNLNNSNNALPTDGLIDPLRLDEDFSFQSRNVKGRQEDQKKQLELKANDLIPKIINLSDEIDEECNNLFLLFKYKTTPKTNQLGQKIKKKFPEYGFGIPNTLKAVYKNLQINLVGNDELVEKIKNKIFVENNKTFLSIRKSQRDLFKVNTFSRIKLICKDVLTNENELIICVYGEKSYKELLNEDFQFQHRRTEQRKDDELERLNLLLSKEVIEGDLDLRNKKQITSLGNVRHVKGTCNLENSGIKEIPEGLIVDKCLLIDKTTIMYIPPSCKIRSGYTDNIIRKFFWFDSIKQFNNYYEEHRRKLAAGEFEYDSNGQWKKVIKEK